MWRSWDYKEKAAEVLKLTSEDMLANRLIDGIIPEPLGGAHYNPQAMAEIVKAKILEDLKALRVRDIDELVNERINKFCSMGVVIEE